jgi:hypothetical protein
MMSLLPILYFSVILCSSTQKDLNPKDYIFGNTKLVKIADFEEPLKLNIKYVNEAFFEGFRTISFGRYFNPFLKFLRENFANDFVEFARQKSAMTKVSSNFIGNCWRTIYLKMLGKSKIIKTVPKAFSVLFDIHEGTSATPFRLADLLKDNYNSRVNQEMKIKDKVLGPSMFCFLFSFLIFKYLELPGGPARENPLPANIALLHFDNSLPENFTGGRVISHIAPKEISSSNISSLGAPSNVLSNSNPSASSSDKHTGEDLLSMALEDDFFDDGPSTTSTAPIIVDENPYDGTQQTHIIDLPFGSPGRHLFGNSELMTEARFREITNIDVTTWNENFIIPSYNEPTHPFYTYVKTNYSDVIKEHFPFTEDMVTKDSKWSGKVWQDVYEDMLLRINPRLTAQAAFAEFFGDNIYVAGSSPELLCKHLKNALYKHYHYWVFEQETFGAMKFSFMFSYLIWEQKNPNNKVQIIDNSGEQSISAAQTLAPPSNATQSRKRTIDSNLPTEKIHSSKNFGPDYNQNFVNVWQMPTNESSVQNIPESNRQPSSTRNYLGSVAHEVPQKLDVQRVSYHNPSKKQKLPTPYVSPTNYEDNPHRSNFLNRTLYNDDFLDEDFYEDFSE